MDPLHNDGADRAAAAAAEADAWSVLCASIRRNDPQMPHVELVLRRVYDPAFTHPAGAALLTNTNISSITIVINDGDFHRRRRRRASYADRANCPLLRYFRSSRSLREVELDFGTQGVQPHFKDSASLICAALTDSRSLQTLKVRRLLSRSGVLGLASLLRSTNSLQEFDFEMQYFERANHAGQNLVAGSFGSNRTLKTLHFECDNAPRMTDLVLRHLQAHPTLLTLSLAGDTWHNHWYTSFHQFMAATSMLAKLCLNAFRFGHDEMEVLVCALHSNRSLRALELYYCNLNIDASRRFTALVQTQCNRQGAQGNQVRELRLCGCTMGMQGRGSQRRGEMAATMLIHSALESFHFDDGQEERIDHVKFFEVLSTNAATIHISSLTLGYLTRKEMKVLTRYLATCLHLEELIVSLTPASDLSLAFCRAVYYSAGLCNAGLWAASSGSTPELTPMESRLVESGCARNENLAELLAAPNLSGCTQNNGDGTTELADLSLFPSLFRVAQHAPRTALNNMLIGLLATTDRGGASRGIRRTIPQQGLEDAVP
jgi:hypothetical protein